MMDDEYEETLRFSPEPSGDVSAMADAAGYDSRGSPTGGFFIDNEDDYGDEEEIAENEIVDDEGDAVDGEDIVGEEDEVAEPDPVVPEIKKSAPSAASKTAFNPNRGPRSFPRSPQFGGRGRGGRGMRGGPGVSSRAFRGRIQKPGITPLMRRRLGPPGKNVFNRLGPGAPVMTSRNQMMNGSGGPAPLPPARRSNVWDRVGGESDLRQDLNSNRFRGVMGGGGGPAWDHRPRPFMGPEEARMAFNEQFPQDLGQPPWGEDFNRFGERRPDAWGPPGHPGDHPPPFNQPHPMDSREPFGMEPPMGFDDRRNFNEPHNMRNFPDRRPYDGPPREFNDGRPPFELFDGPRDFNGPFDGPRGFGNQGPRMGPGPRGPDNVSRDVLCAVLDTLKSTISGDRPQFDEPYNDPRGMDSGPRQFNNRQPQEGFPRPLMENFRGPWQEGKHPHNPGTRGGGAQPRQSGPRPPIPKFQVAVIHKLSNKKFTPEEGNQIRSMLLSEIMRVAELAMKDKSQPQLRFLKSGLLDNGVYSISAENEETFRWLLRWRPPFLNSPNSPKPLGLRVVRMSVMSNKCKIGILVKEKVSLDNLLNGLLVKNGNSGINFRDWRVLSLNYHGESRYIVFAVDENTVRTLEKLNWKLQFDNSILVVHLLT